MTISSSQELHLYSKNELKMTSRSLSIVINDNISFSIGDIKIESDGSNLSFQVGSTVMSISDTEVKIKGKLVIEE